MDKPHYSVEQLIADDSFLAYVWRSDDEAINHWENWIKRHPDQLKNVDEARRIIQLMAIRPEAVSDALIDAETQKLEARLSAIPNAVNPIIRSAPKHVLWQPWSWVAASLLILLTAALVTWYAAIQPPDLLRYQTAAGESKMVMLPDSSIVFLAGNSSIRYPQSWQPKALREVWLEGEAFFHVKPKPVPGGVKFLVHTSRFTVEVLGTRFNVLDRDTTTQVVLNSGKVKVNMSEGREDESIFMQPGEMIELTKTSPKPVKTRVNLAPNPAQKENKIVFNNTSIREIALVIEEYYGLKVRLQDSSIADLKVSGTFPTNNEKSFFKALAVILNLEINKESGQEVFFKYNQ